MGRRQDVASAVQPRFFCGKFAISKLGVFQQVLLEAELGSGMLSTNISIELWSKAEFAMMLGLSERAENV